MGTREGDTYHQNRLHLIQQIEAQRSLLPLPLPQAFQLAPVAEAGLEKPQ